MYAGQSEHILEQSSGLCTIYKLENYMLCNATKDWYILIKTLLSYIQWNKSTMRQILCSTYFNHNSYYHSFSKKVLMLNSNFNIIVHIERECLRKHNPEDCPFCYHSDKRQNLPITLPHLKGRPFLILLKGLKPLFFICCPKGPADVTAVVLSSQAQLSYCLKCSHLANEIWLFMQE